MSTMTYTGELTVITCWCGIAHAVPSSLRQEQIREHEVGNKVMSIYCPLGHEHWPAGESESVRLRRLLEQERNAVARERSRRDQAEASARAYKGVATRTRNRAKAGVCPCCRRSFKQLRTHMSKMHPDFDPANIPSQ